VEAQAVEPVQVQVQAGQAEPRAGLEALVVLVLAVLVLAAAAVPAVRAAARDNQTAFLQTER
jgi:hypothetical protein